MSFVQDLLSWYQENARELPWRSVITPYRSWVSEIMLQQTQVDTVLPFFTKWMARFPSLEALASADEQDVLTVWEGLGYYSRARNLHAAARKVVAQYDGKLPASSTELQKLPGIGRYTAAAIASIAFQEDVAAVDGNIRRVLSRIFDVTEPARSAAGEEILWSLAEQHLPEGLAGDYNQALMDLGAMICTPKNPNCDDCPISAHCLALQKGVQEKRPVKLPRKKVPHLTVTAAVIRKNGQVLLAKRPQKGLLGGLWEFPGGTMESEDADLQSCLKREIQEELGARIHVGPSLGIFRHAYTHFKITLHPFLCELVAGEQPQAIECDDLAWVSFDEFDNFPMGKVDRQIARQLVSEGVSDG